MQAFAEYGFTPERLKTLTQPELQIILERCDGASFGATREFMLAIKHLDEVGGLPQNAAIGEWLGDVDPFSFFSFSYSTSAG